MFTDKVNHKGQSRREAERQTDSHRGFIQIQKSRALPFQTEEGQAENQFPKHVDTTMLTETTNGLLRIEVTAEAASSGVAEIAQKQ